ncbi:alpha/beta fold hydrolase [Variovorax paradoxus]|uniref:alpha/beta fold hydrolase n=1 Tax=Variovorax paradoxus TaxID=34073 RepID=UPI002783AFB2|nr:alpha/beta hydrolase [Variovorax paradoxus]MDQ0586351.1 pimeloyl-ACP methyl ester carboxylesterase [Variovorax paradoxus]
MARESTLSIDGLTLSYRSAGDPRSPWLVLLHGWPQSKSIYDPVLGELGKDAHAVAFDLPGISGSLGVPAPSPCELHELAGLLLRAAESLGAHSIVFAGVDIGGMLAFAAAREHGTRIAGAVVMNTVIPGVAPWSRLIADPRIWHFAFHAIPQLPEQLVSGRERAYFDYFYDLLAGDRHALTDEIRNDWTRAYERPEALKAGFDWYRALEKAAQRNAQPVRIDTPLLYLRGDAGGRDIDDYVEGLRQAGAANLRSRLIPGSGEYLPVEAPAATCEALRAFRAELGHAA